MKKTLIIGVAAAVVIAGGIFAVVFINQPEKTPVKNNRTVPVIYTQADNQFTLKADKADALGVESDSTFTLSTKEPVSADLIKGNLAVEPKIAYKVQSSDSNTFSITPESALEKNTVYTFSVVAQAEGAATKREYQWAYQIKDNFKITGTLPRDKTANIPQNTGIEIIFSHENYTDFENFITITPQVSGRFEQHRKTLAFVPDSLAPGTLYTVLVKKGLPLSGSSDTLAEDYSFQFETDTQQAPQGGLSFSKDFFEYPSNEAPILTMQQYSDNPGEVQVEAFKYPTFEAFAEAVKSLDAVPYWAYYARRNSSYSTDGLISAVTFQAEVKQSDYQRYIEFPEQLSTGQYLIQITRDNNTAQAFLQVGNLTASYQGGKENSFIWAHSLDTQKPASGTTVSFSHDRQFTAKTDKEGLAEFASPALTTDESEGLTSTYYFTLDNNGEKLLLPVVNHYGTWMSSTASEDYWSYLYTNRTLYSPTDSIKFWGVIKSRSDKQEAQELQVRLVSYGYYYNEDSNPIIDQKTLPVSSFGTFTGSFDYANLNPGGYSIQVLAGGEEILSTWVDVATYTKPPYKIEVTTEKKAIFEGEDAVFNIKSAFFDGTPVANLDLEYTGALGSGQVKTDVNGQAQVTLQSSYTNAGYYPNYAYFSIHPVKSEISEISTDANIYTFGPHYDLQSTIDNDGLVSGSVHQVDLASINKEGGDFKWEYQGDPVANLNLGIKIYREYYTKTETGTFYDFINKKTNKTYNYDFHSDFTKESTAVSDKDGKFTYDFKAETNDNYKIEITATDAEGRQAKSYAYYYQGPRFYGYNSGYDNYYLITSQVAETENQPVYQPGQDITLNFNKNEELLAGADQKNFVYFKAQKNFFDIEVSKNPTIEFKYKDSYAPNIYAYGIYFDGRSYHLTDSLNMKYDTSLKKLNIDIQQDKKFYRPGEKVTMNLNVTDKDKRPVRAEVNISAIDEALAAIQWENPINILSTLYQNLPTPLAFVYQSYDKALTANAEGGGCFTGETEILMSDGSKKNIADIKIGDEVLTRRSPQSDEMAAAKVTNKLVHMVDSYLTINGFLNVTPEHIVYLNGDWQTIGTAKIGDELMDYSGNKIVIESIVAHHLPTAVYNLKIQNYHTFIADGIYVHNEKGGGRENFQDIAYFGSAETGSDGQATVQFTLPDNVTSWQTAVHALTKDLQADATQTAVISTLPFFVDVSASANYLVGDKPTVKLRSFGTGLKTGENVIYDITYPGFSEETQTLQGGAADPVEFTLPDFAEGDHSIKVKAHQGNSEDTVTKKIMYRTSNITTGVTRHYLLAPQVQIEGSSAGRTNLTFVSEDRGQYYNYLKYLSFAGSDRVDQKVANFASASLLNQYFGENNTAEAINFTDYQVGEGGLSLLPYSSADLLLTAKAMEMAGDQFDTQLAKSYFRGILDNKSSNIDEVAYALFGLANLHEPVLTDINLLIDNNEVPPELMLYLARAVSNLGATEYAATLLQQVINDHGVQSDPYLKIDLGTTQDDNTEYTYQAAILAAAVSSDQAGKLFDYAQENPARDQLNVLDELAYIKTSLPLLTDNKVSFSYTLGAETKPIELTNNQALTVSVTPEQLQQITFSAIDGQVGVIASYQQAADWRQLPTDNLVSVKREYLVNGQAVTKFNESDIVQINLTPTIAEKALDNEYQLTDYLPAGLKLLTNITSRGLDYDQQLGFPYEVNGQAVKFWTGKPAKAFHYYAIVVGKGQYKAEPAEIQGFVAKDSRNFSQALDITIN
ncbi:MAG: polymorphic toxin-type HINT domain-containing protein [Patescibacteria group bacterium]|jgi:uncharacterized protein YfaS (alpha-2-macroglobulin family)